MTTTPYPTEPAPALAALRAAKDELFDDQVRLFQSMPLRDRLELLFRLQLSLALSSQTHREALEIIATHLGGRAQ